MPNKCPSKPVEIIPRLILQCSGSSIFNKSFRMDISRAILDNLMGRDRNKRKDDITERDHYSNSDVCKPFLICFCFNSLFPNTTYDEGACEKRHDTYLKTMFDNDLERAVYERDYIRCCINWIQRRLQEVEKKAKQNLSVIENKSIFPADRSKQTLDRIMVIDEDIERLIREAEIYGSKGQIDDSSRCMEEVEKLRERRREIESMGSDLMNVQKQQKICEICGAIQTIDDTQKRIQTHLEGKIHQGFLKLRHQVETLKIRLEMLNKMNPQLTKETTKEPERAKDTVRRERSPSPKKQKRSRSKQKERERERSRQKDRERRQKERQRDRHDKDKGDRDRSGREKDRYDDRHYRESSRERKEKKKHKDSRQRGKEHHQRSHKSHKQYKDRDRQRERDSHREHKEHKKKHKKDRSHSYERHERHY